MERPSDKCVFLSGDAKLGEMRETLRPGVRFSMQKSDVIYYREVGGYLGVSRVIRRDRDLSSL